MLLPTDVLKNEHRVIEQVLDCLEGIAVRASRDGDFDTQSAEEAIDFFRNFADRCHHGKEEHQLFPALEARGFSPENGPTGVMRSEHETGRGYIRGMVGAIETQSAETFASFAHAYIDMLRVHIRKEDHCLFPMADSALDVAGQTDLMAQFERVEAEDMGAGVHERYLRLANDLADRYGVPHATATCAEHGKAFACGH